MGRTELVKDRTFQNELREFILRYFWLFSVIFGYDRMRMLLSRTSAWQRHGHRFHITKNCWDSTRVAEKISVPGTGKCEFWIFA
jgi:hypothetical protein